MRVVEFLSTFVGSLGAFGYLLVGLAALVESIIFIGFVVPGGTFIAFMGFVSSGGGLNPFLLALIAIIGSIIGDCVSYYLGGHGARWFKKENKILRLSHLEMGQKFFNKYGAPSVFLGRFLAPIRPAIAFVAGVAKMNFKSFMFWNTTSAIVWSSAYVCIGYFFGASLPIIEMWIKRVGVFSVLFILVAIILWVLLVKWTFVAKGFSSLYRKEAILPTAFVFLVLAVAFFELSNDYVFVKEFLAVDNFVNNALDIVRGGLISYVFYSVTLLGGFWFVFLLSLATIIWAFSKKLYEYAIGLFVSVAGSGLVILIGKILIARTRPEEMFVEAIENSFSFPSGHAGMAVALYGFLAYMLIDRGNKIPKKYIVTVTSFLVLIIGFSRLFLGVHYLTDVLGGFMVGFLWLVGGILLSESIQIRKK